MDSYFKYFIVPSMLFWHFSFAQCDSDYTYFETVPSNVSILSGDNCLYNQDLQALNDLVTLNELDYASPIEVGTQTWFNGRLKILVADYGFSGSGVNDTIYTLPESIGNWTSLSGLYLEWNRISILPQSFNKLKELRSLYISNNNLSGIINDIDSLTHLTYLDLGYNEIDSLPNSLCNLNELQYLWLFNNNLSSVPDCMCSLNIDWDSDDDAWYPYFAIGGNNLCENIPECIVNSDNFNTSLDQFYYSFQTEAPQDCDNVAIDISLANDFILKNPFPNPFNPKTVFNIEIEEEEVVNISIYDINGSLIESIFSGKLSKGIYNFSWSALRFSSGIYFIEVKTTSSIEYKKILLTK